MKYLYLLGITILACNVTGCSAVVSAICKDDVQSEVSSPQNDFVASVILRNCGATADFSTIVTIKDRDDAHQFSKEDVFVLRGDNVVSISWIDENTLKVDCKECDSKDIFKNLNSWRQVAIKY